MAVSVSATPTWLFIPSFVSSPRRRSPLFLDGRLLISRRTVEVVEDLKGEDLDAPTLWPLLFTPSPLNVFLPSSDGFP